MDTAFANSMKNIIFKRVGLLVFSLITILSLLFIIITYVSATYFFNASTELLNKDVAAHIARFTSPFETTSINKRKADSVFYNAMVVSPSIEVYFLDTSGTVIYYEAPDSAIKLKKIPLRNIDKLIVSKGKEYITSPDPKYPDNNKIFSAAEVIKDGNKLGYIYVILGSKEYNNTSELLFTSHAATLGLEAFSIIIIVSFILSFYYIKRLQRRYNAILSVLHQYHQGNFAARFTENKNDEFAPVTSSFNTMADLLSQNISRLKKTEEERKNFIANISHDLRTPLSIASGYAETLLHNKETNDTGQQKDFSQLIVTKLKQVETMVMQLFELSRLDAADFKTEEEPFVFSEILQEITNSFEMSATAKNIQIACVGCTEVIWTKGDIKMMERVIQNLISNAIKNTPDNGKILVQLIHKSNQLTTVIENTGDPLSSELINRINSDEKEQTLHATPSHRKGLGLTIVKRILALHNAKLLAKNGTGLGNQFSFTLPVYNP